MDCAVFCISYLGFEAGLPSILEGRMSLMHGPYKPAEAWPWAEF